MIMKSDILFYSNGLAIWHGFPDIIYNKINNFCKSAILNLIELKLHILFYCNGLAICHSLLNSRYIKVNNGSKSIILNLIVYFFRGIYPTEIELFFINGSNVAWVSRYHAYYLLALLTLWRSSH